MFVIYFLTGAYLLRYAGEFGLGRCFFGCFFLGCVEVEEGEGEIGLGHHEAEAGVKMESYLA